MLGFIIKDIYEELIENDISIDFEEVENTLIYLSENPININSCTQTDLEQLFFLSSNQIDDILLYAYKHPFTSLSELRLIPSLENYEIRNLLPFLIVGESQEKEKLYFKDIFKYGKNEISLRLNLNNIEQNNKDPFNFNIRYRFNYKNRIEFGITADRDANEPFYYYHKTYGADFYGGYLQLQNFGVIEKIVIGDYNVSLAEGLIMNTKLNFSGKSALIENNGFQRSNIQRKTSAQEYGFMRGIATKIDLKNTSITAFLSSRKVDGHVENHSFGNIQKTGFHTTTNQIENKRAVWQNIIGINADWKIKRAHIGISAVEQIYSDTLNARTNYYSQNLLYGIRQFSASTNFNLHFNKFSISDELAVTQNTTWGIGNIAYLKYIPVSSIILTLSHRYYSPYFYSPFSAAISTTSRVNDENAIFLGANINSLKNWHFYVYTDIYKSYYPKYGIRQANRGIEAVAKAEYNKNNSHLINIKAQLKNSLIYHKYSLKLSYIYNINNLTLTTIAEGNIVKLPTNNTLNYGGVLAQSIKYDFHKNIKAEIRGEIFYTDTYNNRMYVYENDVLYAFSIPMLYGTGGRWYANMSWKINEKISIYLKAAQTIYTKKWYENHSLNYRHNTYIHSTIKIKI